MKTKKKSRPSLKKHVPLYAYGGFGGVVLGILAVSELRSGAAIVAAGLTIMAAYCYYITHRRGSTHSPAPLVALLVIATFSVSGAYFFNQSYAWHPKGMIKKSVQNVTASSPVVDANGNTSALDVRSGDILTYTVTVSNIAADAAKHYNDLAYTVMTDELPQGVELVSDPSKRKIVENIGTILPGNSVTKSYQVRVRLVSDSGPDFIKNTACFTANSVVKDNPQSGCESAAVKVHPKTVTPSPAPSPAPTPTPQPTPAVNPKPAPAPAATPVALPAAQPARLLSVGPSEVLIVAVFAVTFGYIAHTMYRYLSHAK